MNIFFPKFVKFLQDFFMPYCFIWCGLVLKGLNVSRVNNGSLEKYIGHKKSKIKSLEPAEYVNYTYLSTKGRVIDFQNHVNSYKQNECDISDNDDGDDDNYDAVLSHNGLDMNELMV